MIVHALYLTIMSMLLGISVYAVNTPIHKVSKDKVEKAGEEEGSTQQP